MASRLPSRIAKLPYCSLLGPACIGSREEWRGPHFDSTGDHLCSGFLRSLLACTHLSSCFSGQPQMQSTKLFAAH